MRTLIKSVTLLLMLALFVQCSNTDVTSSTDNSLPQAPEYSDTTQWYISDRHAKADVFYVISTETGDYLLPDGTTCHHADTYRDSTRLPMYGEMLGVDTLISGGLNYYSPYYRQCSLQTFGNDSLSEACFPIALDDARHAFKYYIEYLNGGRPFVLAGFSQGARIILELLKEMDNATFGRMIAAYAIGCEITPDILKNNHRIIAAQGADDTGVTICYNSVRDISCAIMGNGNAIAINPVNWRTDNQPAKLVTEPSPLKPVDQQQRDSLTIRLDTATNLLLVDGYSATDYMLPLIGKEGCYHSREIWLYRQQLRENITLRTQRFLHQ